MNITQNEIGLMKLCSFGIFFTIHGHLICAYLGSNMFLMQNLQGSYRND
jgi:hypothetical protein